MMIMITVMTIHDNNYDEDDLGCPFVYGRMKE